MYDDVKKEYVSLVGALVKSVTKMDYVMASSSIISSGMQVSAIFANNLLKFFCLAFIFQRLFVIKSSKKSKIKLDCVFVAIYTFCYLPSSPTSSILCDFDRGSSIKWKNTTLLLFNLLCDISLSQGGKYEMKLSKCIKMKSYSKSWTI